LREVVRQFHARGVKIFIDYNPWDTGTRRPGKPDEEAVAEIVAELEADGVFLDTMNAGSGTFRAAVDRVRPGVVFEPEVHPAIDQLEVCSASWAQWLEDPVPPGMLHLKWIEPRHMQHQIRRWNLDHRVEIETAFFNGSGMLIWENVFGTYNPWTAEDRALWRRAAAILEPFAENFASKAWEPFHPALSPGLYVHRWPGDGATVYTVRNMGEPLRDAPLFEITDAESRLAVCDLWNAKSIPTEGKLVVGSVEGLGCFAVGRADDPRIQAALQGVRKGIEAAPNSNARAVRSVVDPKPVERTPLAERSDPPAGMVYVAGGVVRLRLDHMRRECGCYPDPNTPAEKAQDFLWGSPHDGRIVHDYSVPTPPFFIDEAEVSNAEFKRFLDETNYRPKHPENFLKHWPNGVMPPKLAEHPVVYVDLDDARAYAKWAGKRLPTEMEWQFSAQGTDEREWPWGKEFDPARCNSGGQGTMEVRSLPEGRSPFGCYHMAGNVWEWTESERDDGHTRFAILRGGSWFEAKGSVWYVPGGPQPCTSHTKFLLMWPGLDRCGTVGFRCVKDV
jgi:formylglycine-generating enzyme required for sulfatase activity